MAKVTYARRKKMKGSSFVFPKGTKAAPGQKKFPIHDVKHARQALSRAAQRKSKLTDVERCQVVRAVCKKYPEVGVCGMSTERKAYKKSKLTKCRPLSFFR